MVSRFHYAHARLFSLLGVLLFASLTLAGCTPKDTVQLLYTPVTPSVIPAPTAPRVAVVLFEDKRPNKDAIGIKRNGTAFLPNSLVTEWVSRALADEIGRMGPQVSYAPSAQLAQSARPDYIVTGAVEEVWLKEVSTATYTSTVQITVSLANRAGKVFSQTLSSTQEKTGIPKSGLVDSIMTDTLREVLGVAASKITESTK